MVEGDFCGETDHLAYFLVRPSTLRQPVHGATMGGLSLRQGERASGAGWSVSLRQSPK
jgi:hypothetical protein